MFVENEQFLTRRRRLQSETAPQLGTLDTPETALSGEENVVEQTGQKETQTVLHTGRRRNIRKMENFYYECIYDVLRGNRPHEEKLTALNRFRAKRVQLHSVPLQRIMIENEETYRMESENPTLHHVLRM